MPPPDSAAEIIEPRDAFVTRQPLDLRLAREQVARLEARATNGLESESSRSQAGTEEGESLMIDSARVAELHGQGLSQNAIARQLGCSRDRVKRCLGKGGLLEARPEKANLVRLNEGRNIVQPRRGSGNAESPGKRENGRGAELAAVERLLADHWRSLSLVDRLKIFLSPRP